MIEELEDRCVACDLVEIRDGAELPEETTACDSLLDSVLGLPSSGGDCKSFPVKVGFPPACLIARAAVASYEIDDLRDDLAD